MRNGSFQIPETRSLCLVALHARLVTLATRIAQLAQTQNIAQATRTQSLMMVNGRSACAHATADGQELIVVCVHPDMCLIQHASLARSMAIVVAMRALLPTMETGQVASALAIAGTVDVFVACVLQGTCHTLSVRLAALPSIAVVMPCLLWKMAPGRVVFVLATAGIVV